MRKKFFYFFMIVYVLQIVVNLLSGKILGIIQPVIFAVSLWFTFNLVNQVSAGGNNNSGLTSDEKWKVILTEFFSPIIAGAFYYYSWRKNFPNKAGQANKYSWLMLGLGLILAVVYIVYIVKTVKPS